MYVINYVYYLFLIIIFFYYGLFLSIFIDYLFPDIKDGYPEYLTFIETILELLFVYIIYFIFKNYINQIIGFFINDSKLKYLDTLLLLSFSIGIYKHLYKSNMKIDYFKQKYIINNIRNYKVYKMYDKLMKFTNKN